MRENESRPVAGRYKPGWRANRSSAPARRSVCPLRCGSVDTSCVVPRKVVAQESTRRMQCIRAKQLAGCYPPQYQRSRRVLADATNVVADVTCLDAHTTRLYPRGAV